MCYTACMVRRGLIIALALSLAGLGPVPLSACALFSSKLVECATPKTESRCDQMNMDESGAKFAAGPDTSCCYISNAPLPESQYVAPELSLTATPAVVSDATRDLPRLQGVRLADVAQNLSPPPLQSLLCTFLI